jgi:hypothetical protein
MLFEIDALASHTQPSRQIKGMHNLDTHIAVRCYYGDRVLKGGPQEATPWNTFALTTQGEVDINSTSRGSCSRSSHQLI